MRPFRAALLDAMGTLLDLEPPAPVLRRELAERFGVRIDDDAAEAAMAREIAYYRAHSQDGRDRSSLVSLRRRCTAVLAAELGEAVREVPAADLRDALLGSLRFRPYREVPAALRRLRAARVRLVVVSNWDCSLHDVLAETGLSELVHGVITSAELGTAKPSRGIFAHALTIAGVPASDAVHVGDSLREDVDGARAAGIEPIFVRRPRARRGSRAPVRRGAEGVTTIASLSELADAAA